MVRRGLQGENIEEEKAIGWSISEGRNADRMVRRHNGYM